MACGPAPSGLLGKMGLLASLTASLLDLFFRTRLFSPNLFLLLDEPQPRKTNDEDHHDDENDVLGHRNRPELRHQ